MGYNITSMYRSLFICFILFVLVAPLAAPVEARTGGKVVKGVESQGSCAVVGMSAESCQLIALRRARSAAIEQAVGVKVSSSTVITNMRLAVDFIETYSQGYIVREKVQWLPFGTYQRDSSTPPIPEYRVKVKADVYISALRVKPIGLSATLNRKSFRAGEKARINVRVGRRSMLAIFNITADDKVVMLFPNDYVSDNLLPDGRDFVFPSEGSGIVLKLANLPGHKQDAEAIFVVAVDPEMESKLRALFRPMESMSLTTFFSRYSKISDYAEDAVMAYEVVAVEKP